MHKGFSGYWAACHRVPNNWQLLRHTRMPGPWRVACESQNGPPHPAQITPFDIGGDVTMLVMILGG